MKLGSRGPGQYFGFSALVFEERIEPVTVRVVEKAIVLSISADLFEKLCEECPSMGVTGLVLVETTP